MKPPVLRPRVAQSKTPNSQLRVLAIVLLGRLAFELPSVSKGDRAVCIVALVALTIAVVVVCSSNPPRAAGGA